MSTRTLSLAEIEEIAFDALVAVGTSEANARPLAVATAATEADGVASHGLAYLPIYCEHVSCGKVDGSANPRLTPAASGLSECRCGNRFRAFCHRQRVRPPYSIGQRARYCRAGHSQQL